MEDNVVCVAAFDKGTGYMGPVTSCDSKDAQHYAKYYRSIGYNARVLTYEELDQIQEKEMIERRERIQFE